MSRTRPQRRQIEVDLWCGGSPLQRTSSAVIAITVRRLINRALAIAARHNFGTNDVVDFMWSRAVRLDRDSSGTEQSLRIASRRFLVPRSRARHHEGRGRCRLGCKNPLEPRRLRCPRERRGVESPRLSYSPSISPARFSSSSRWLNRIRALASNGCPPTPARSFVGTPGSSRLHRTRRARGLPGANFMVPIAEDSACDFQAPRFSFSP